MLLLIRISAKNNEYSTNNTIPSFPVTAFEFYCVNDYVEYALFSYRCVFHFTDVYYLYRICFADIKPFVSVLK